MGEVRVFEKGDTPVELVEGLINMRDGMVRIEMNVLTNVRDQLVWEPVFHPAAWNATPTSRQFRASLSNINNGTVCVRVGHMLNGTILLLTVIRRGGAGRSGGLPDVMSCVLLVDEFGRDVVDIEIDTVSGSDVPDMKMHFVGEILDLETGEQFGVQSLPKAVLDRLVTEGGQYAEVGVDIETKPNPKVRRKFVSMTKEITASGKSVRLPEMNQSRRILKRLTKP
jgi:hypothetical protein